MGPLPSVTWIISLCPLLQWCSVQSQHLWSKTFFSFCNAPALLTLSVPAWEPQTAPDSGCSQKLISQYTSKCRIPLATLGQTKSPWNRSCSQRQNQQNLHQSHSFSLSVCLTGTSHLLVICQPLPLDRRDCIFQLCPTQGLKKKIRISETCFKYLQCLRYFVVITKNQSILCAILCWASSYSFPVPYALLIQCI